LGLSDSERAVLADARPNAALAPPGGKSTICFGMDSCTEAKKRETVLAPPGGKSTMSLGMAAAPSSNAFACGTHQNSGNVLTDRPSTGLHAPPGGKSTICLGMDTSENFRRDKEEEANTGLSPRPAGKSSEGALCPAEALVPRPVGGEDRVVLGANAVEVPRPVRATAGGNSSICFGTDVREWQLSSRVLGPVAEMKIPSVKENEVKDVEAELAQDSKEEGGAAEAEEMEAEPVPPTAPVPPGGAASVVLGSDVREWKSQEDNGLVKTKLAQGEDRTMKQDLPTPARSIRAPPGGAATVLLG